MAADLMAYHGLLHELHNEVAQTPKIFSSQHIVLVAKRVGQDAVHARAASLELAEVLECPACALCPRRQVPPRVLLASERAGLVRTRERDDVSHCEHHPQFYERVVATPFARQRPRTKRPGCVSHQEAEPTRI